MLNAICSRTSSPDRQVATSGPQKVMKSLHTTEVLQWNRPLLAGGEQERSRTRNLWKIAPLRRQSEPITSGPPFPVVSVTPKPPTGVPSGKRLGGEVKHLLQVDHHRRVTLWKPAAASSSSCAKENHLGLFYLDFIRLLSETFPFLVSLF